MLNGLIFYCLINVYAAGVDFLQLADHKLLPEIGLYSLIFGCLTLLAFFHMLFDPAECAPRKIAVLTLYISCITYAIHLGGEMFLWLYPMLLWAVLGYGFRFGNRYLLIGAVLSVAAFTALISLSPFWQKYPALSWGCVAGLIILPAYVSVLIRKLSEAKRQAEESNRAKSAFLASISHELRTPLNAVIGLSDLMKATPLTREQRDMNETIGESGRALLSLINAILDLSRLEVGRMPKKEQKIDLYRLLHRVMSMIEVPARAKRLDISLQIAADVPRFATSYLKHIEDSVVNLASNAVKFTETGFVHIHVRVLSAAAGKLRLRLEVSDSGIGVAKDVQHRIFERFTQADDTIIDKFGGTGLGLATVKQMIEDIGGEVGVVSDLGAGSTFWFELEVTPSEEAVVADWKDAPVVLVTTDLKAISMFERIADRVVVQEQPEAAVAYLASNEFVDGSPIVILDSRVCGSDLPALAKVFARRGAAYHKLAVIMDQQDGELPQLPGEFSYMLRRPFEAGEIAKALTASLGPKPLERSRLDAAGDGKPRASYAVLVADDNKVNRTVIGKILSQAGHKPTVVENGQQALDLMQDAHFDVALFDLNMPVLSGTEAAQLYAFSCLGGTKIPIAALTADATPEAERRCSEAGMVACLTKPIEAPVLLAALDDIVRAHGRGEEIAAAAAASPSASPAPLSEDEEDPIDLGSLRDLYDLGGAEFVQQVLEHFLTEAGDALARLEQAVAELDYKVFRDEAHALRSGAANVGARKVFRICLQWREITPQDIAAKGDECVREMSEAVTECSDALVFHCRRMMLDEILPQRVDTSTGTINAHKEDDALNLRKAS